MKDVREVFKGADDGDYFEEQYSYGLMLDSFEFEILVKEDFGSYDGDTKVVLKDGNRYGYMVFGWGSCSYCDALQSCGSYGELESLQKSLFNGIKWFESKSDLVVYFKDKDWALEWYGDEDECKAFSDTVIKFLMQEDV